MFYGAGAGGHPTASVVLGDTVAIARNLLAGLRGPDSSAYAQLPLVPIGDARARSYVQLDVADRPGVLAPVADAFAQQGVSIKAVRQEGRGEDANLIIMTHVAREAALAKAVAVLGAMEAVRNVDSVMRVEALEGEGTAPSPGHSRGAASSASTRPASRSPAAGRLSRAATAARACCP